MAKRLIRLPEVLDKTGSNTCAIYAGMKAGTFPKNVPIGKKSVGWVEDEIDQWISDRIAARDGSNNKRKAGPGRGHTGPIGGAVEAA
jgi:prophage regulatory protein